MTMLLFCVRLSIFPAAPPPISARDSGELWPCYSAVSVYSSSLRAKARGQAPDKESSPG